MKALTLIAVLVLTGCAHSEPYWQQNLNNMYRQWRVQPVSVQMQPVKPVEYPGNAQIMCRF